MPSRVASDESGARPWPSVYLIDKNGDVRYRRDGELDWKDAEGQEKVRKKIEDLLGEKE